MFHTCHIKFGAITNLTDARYAAAVYAKWIGFCLDPQNPRYITPLKAKEIIGWISGSELVAEIGSLLPENMLEALQILGIKTVQVNNTEAAYLWKNAGYEVILEGEDSEDFISLNAQLSGRKNEIVDITEWNMDQLENLKRQPPFAININGGDESAPGIRDFADIDDILVLFETP